MKRLVERYPMLVNKPSSDGLTALHLAVLSNRREIVQLLLQTVRLLYYKKLFSVNR